MEVETSGVHSHLNDRSRICSYVRRSKRSFMARLAGAHVSTSRPRLGSTCLQRQSACCCFVEKSGSSQRLQAYRRSISLCLGLHHFRESRSREDIHNRQCRRWNDQVSFGRPVPVFSATDGRNDISVRLKPDTVQVGFGHLTSVHRRSALALPTRPVRSSVFRSSRLNKTDLFENLCLYMYFLDNPCIRPLRGSVEYECIMAVFTLSLWTSQVRAISVNSIKGSCPKLVTL